MSVTTKYQYEIAFSFLQQDEALAFEINDLIQDRYSTFIYSQHQKELAGADGEIKFNEVFGEKARIVIVLYRESWGGTPWTRIEETAIRNRAHTEGYDFTMFVQIEPLSKMPKWLPKNRIYFDFTRWGSKGLAPVIESKINEAGGNNRNESVEDRVERLKRQVILQQERKSFLNSREGHGQAQVEFEKLFALLDAKLKYINQANIQLPWQSETHPREKFIIRCEKHGLHFNWSYAYGNTLDGSFLHVHLTSLERSTGSAIFQNDYRKTETQIKGSQYIFDIDPATKETGWSINMEEKSFILSEKLMNDWLKIFLDILSQ